MHRKNGTQERFFVLKESDLKRLVCNSKEEMPPAREYDRPYPPQRHPKHNFNGQKWRRLNDRYD